jgi:hypothetical protein
LLKDYVPLVNPEINKTSPANANKADPFSFRQEEGTKKNRINVLRTLVKSSRVRSIGYRNSKILQVEFKKGVVYQYYNVPESVYEEFMQAESKGRIGSNNIFHSYKYEEV